MRDSVIFYRSFYDAIKDLPAEQFKECAAALIEYALDGREPSDAGIGKTIFIMAKPQIDANNKRFENGKKGGRPTDETKAKPNGNQSITKPKPNGNQTETKHDKTETTTEPNVNVNVNENVNVNVNDNVNENVNVNVNECVNAHARERPSRTDVREYAVSSGLCGITKADRFFDHYDSQGWLTSAGVPIVNWQSKLRAWVTDDVKKPDYSRPINLGRKEKT